MNKFMEEHVQASLTDVDPGVVGTAIQVLTTIISSALFLADGGFCLAYIDTVTYHPTLMSWRNRSISLSGSIYDFIKLSS